MAPRRGRPYALSAGSLLCLNFDGLVPSPPLLSVRHIAQHLQLTGLQARQGLPAFRHGKLASADKGFCRVKVYARAERANEQPAFSRKSLLEKGGFTEP
eukprot:664443-Pelagomonas_calceolata.AAC.1